MTKVQITINNVTNFSQYLNKFLPFKRFLLFDLDGEYLKSIIVNEELHNVVKCHKTPCASIFDMENFPSELGTIKFGIVRIDSFNNSLKRFNIAQPVEIILEVEEVDIGKGIKENIAVKYSLKQEGISFNYYSPDFEQLILVSEEKFKSLVDVSGVVEYDFELTAQDLDRIYKLSNVERNDKTITIRQTEERKIRYSDNCFNYVSENKAEKKSDAYISISKEQFDFLDMESYKVLMTDTKIIFDSVDTQTEIIFSKVEE